MQFTEIVLFSFSLQVIAETFLCLCGLRHNYIAQNDELWVSMIQRVKLTFNQTANSSLTVDEIKTCLRNESWDVWRAGRGGKWVFVSIKLFGMKRSMRLESETIHVKTSASFSPRFMIHCWLCWFSSNAANQNAKKVHYEFTLKIKTNLFP